MALAACDLLARVDTLAGGRDVGGGLDALGVQHARAWFGVPACGLADQSAEQAVELVECAVLLPGGEVSIDGFPRREVVGKVAPGDPGPVHIQDRVHDPAQVVLGRPANVQPLPSPLGPPGRQNGLERFISGIGQVTRMRPLPRHVSIVPPVDRQPQGANRVQWGALGSDRSEWAETCLAMASAVSQVTENDPGLSSPSPLRYPNSRQTPPTGQNAL